MFCQPMGTILQVAGALLILAGYAAAQARLTGQDSYPYLLANLAGSALLAVLAFGREAMGVRASGGCLGGDLGLGVALEA